MANDEFDDDSFWEREPGEIATDMVRGPELFFRPFDLWLAEYGSYVEFWSKNVDKQERWTSVSGKDSIVWDYDTGADLQDIGRSLYCNMEKIRKALEVADQCPLVSKLTAQLKKSGISLHEILSDCGSIPHDSRPSSRVGLQDAIDILKQRLIFESLVSTEHSPKNESESPTGSKTRRRCYERDHTWLEWHKSGLGPAAIRDRWNKENPDDAICLTTKENGRDTVKAGLNKARKE